MISDTERVEFIRGLLGEAWATVPHDDEKALAFWEGILLAIGYAVGFNEEANNEE